MADEHNLNAAYSEVFEESMDTRQAQTVHRIRANSSIMQLKKILGECMTPIVQETGKAANDTSWDFVVANRGEIRKYCLSLAVVFCLVLLPDSLTLV